MRAHELTEKISINGLRIQIQQMLEPKIDEWHKRADDPEDGSLKWDILSDLNEIFAGMEIKFDFEDFPGDAISTGAIYENGHILIHLDPRSIYTGMINLVESPKQWLDGLIRSMTHELIHRSQLEASNVGLRSDDLEMQQYLSYPHEMQAYAKDAVDELLSLYGSKDYLMRSIQKNGFLYVTKESDTMRQYVDYFHEDPDDPKSKVWKTFLRYFYFYLNEHA